MRFKRTKKSRFRGSHTHGWGAKKKHRGAGHRGGRGNAGTGKRADQCKPSVWGERYFGRRGFKSVRKQLPGSINICTIEDTADSLLRQGRIKQESGFIVINLDELGYHKLLSQGKATRKYRIVCRQASARAIEKIKSAGGEMDVQDNTAESA